MLWNLFLLTVGAVFFSLGAQAVAAHHGFLTGGIFGAGLLGWYTTGLFTPVSYGNEAVMLEKLMTETEKEMQTIREAATEKDLQKLDSLTHHLRSSWEVLRADQPLNVLYRLLHGDVLPDGEALSHAVTAVLDKGAEIIRLAEEERRKYEDG